MKVGLRQVSDRNSPWLVADDTFFSSTLFFTQGQGYSERLEESIMFVSAVSVKTSWLVNMSDFGTSGSLLSHWHHPTHPILHPFFSWPPFLIILSLFRCSSGCGGLWASHRDQGPGEPSTTKPCPAWRPPRYPTPWADGDGDWGGRTPWDQDHLQTAQGDQWQHDPPQGLCWSPRWKKELV